MDRDLKFDFLETCVAEARALSERHGTLTLLMSGGVQSEALARIFQRAEIPFQVRIYKICSGNLFDIQRAITYCETHSIAHEVIEWDLREFAPSKWIELAQAYQTTRADWLVALQMCEMTPGHCVRAGGIPLKRPSDALEKSVAQASGNRFHFAFFSSDRISNAYLAHPQMREWERLAPTLGMTDAKEWREIVFRSHWEDLEPRISWTSLEHVQNLLPRPESLC